VALVDERPHVAQRRPSDFPFDSAPIRRSGRNLSLPPLPCRGNQLCGLWLRATLAGFPPACQQTTSSPHVQASVTHHTRPLATGLATWIVPPIMTFWATGEKRCCAAATGGLRRNARFISRTAPGYQRSLQLIRTRHETCAAPSPRQGSPVR
jgi:hypothetical protein